MDDRQSIDLAAMLCSRLCHDMLSPVGALSNGLELLAMETDPEMRANVSSSSGSLSAPPGGSATASK